MVIDNSVGISVVSITVIRTVIIYQLIYYKSNHYIYIYNYAVLLYYYGYNTDNPFGV